ncbi:MAG: flavin reductase family protein [Burkholderiaceae bacterium]|nr:flavin reductase family protein [Burkholderiaceae bacterium]
MQARTSHDIRRALAQFATGVTVVTTRAADGTPVGLTVNSFASVSLQPPLVLWSLACSAQSFDAFRACERYLIHVLAVDQLELAAVFATRGADKFGAARWRDNDAGLPLLEGCVAWFECGNRSQYPEGDHLILVGRVESFAVAGGAPLIFHDSRYVQHLQEAPLPRALRSPWT